MFKGFSGLIVPIILMLCVFAILGGVDPTTRTFTSDRSYLDKEVVQLSASQFFMVIGAVLAFIGMIHKTGNDNEHGGAGHNFITFALLAVLAIIVVMALGGGI